MLKNEPLPHSPGTLSEMATRANLTVEDVLDELDGNEHDDESEDDFDGYWLRRQRRQGRGGS